MLDDTLKTQLKAYLERLTRPVEIVASLDDSPQSAELRELLDELAAASGLVRVDTSGQDERRPSFSLRGEGTATAIRFAAIPLGHEFASLVLALLWAGGHPPKVEDSVIERIRAIDTDLAFEVYMSLSCHNCPDVVQALNLMAAINPRVSVVTIDGGLFQKEVEARDVMAVPTVFLDGEFFASGRMGVEEILAKLATDGGQAEAKRLDAQAPYDVLMVGGGPARACAPGWRPSASAARCSTPCRSRTTSRSRTPTVPPTRPPSSSMCASTMWTS
jgi:alkyl hydroperoxide reductase subunit F